MEDYWKVHLATLLISGAGVGMAAYIGYQMGKSKSQARLQANRKSKTEYLLRMNEEDPILKELRAVSRQHTQGLMTTNIQSGKLLTFLCRNINAKKVLDVGVFTGCSSFAMALGLPDDGKVIACDVSEKYANIGKPYWDRAGVSKKIELRIAPAEETLSALLDEGGKETFDLVFIDADKVNYLKYYELGFELLRKGGLIVVDNMCWSGKVWDRTVVNDGNTGSIRSMNERMRGDPRVDYTLLAFADGTGVAQKLV